METLIRKHKLVAILRNVPDQLFQSYVKCVYDGGIRLLEVALNSEQALAQIQWIRSHYDGKLTVGAGTVISPNLAKEALSAGAQFLLTPSIREDVLQYCADNQVKLLPGVMTPSDVNACVHYGFHTLKLFPAGDLPMGYIKSLKGPFSQTNYVSVGGVSPSNLESFFQHGFIGAGIGSNLVPAELAQAGRWEEASSRISVLCEAAKKF